MLGTEKLAVPGFLSHLTPIASALNNHIIYNRIITDHAELGMEAAEKANGDQAKILGLENRIKTPN